MKKISFLLLIFSSFLLNAQSWNGLINQDWNNPLNWTPNVVPNNVSIITILPSPNIPKFQNNVSIGGISTGNGSSIDFNGYSLTMTGANGYFNITGATLINSNAVTDIVLNLNLTNSGYNFAFNGNVVNDHITINLTGGDTYYEGNISANTFNGNVTYNCNGSQTVRLCDGTSTQYNNNFTFNRLTAGASLLFTSSGYVGGNFNYQNVVGGPVSLGNGTLMTNIQGTCTINANYPSMNTFTMMRVKNQTAGGSISVQNSMAPTIQFDSLKVTNFNIQGFRGNAYTTFSYCKIDGNVNFSDDASYSSGYDIQLRNNLINGNASFAINGTNTFYESHNASSGSTYNGNTTYQLNGSASLYLHQSDKTTYNGNLTITRNAAGYTRIFNAGSNINGNFSYSNNASGNIDFGNTGNLTAISGTVNINVNLSPIATFTMYRLVNQTPGGKINVKNSLGFDVQQDSLKVDSLNILHYRGSGYARFYSNQVFGHLTLADSISYGAGYNTEIRNNTIQGNTQIKMYGSNHIYEAHTTANTFNGNLVFDIFGTGNLYTSYNAKSTITGNYTVNRTGSGYTSLFGNAATIGGNFTYTKNGPGTSNLGTLGSKTTITGTVLINATQDLNSEFSLSRIQNATNGGSISASSLRGFNIQQDTLLITAMNINNYGGSEYAYFYNNQITGNVTLTDVASYTGGYHTQIRNSTITGNTIFNINGSNHFFEAHTTANTYHGNLTFNVTGSGNLYTSYNAKSTINGNYTVNRTSAGYTSLFGNAATITGNFEYTKNAPGTSNLGTLSSKTTISGTININITQDLASEFSLSRIQNLQNGGSITSSSSRGFNIQQDTLLVNSMSITNYGGSEYAYFYNNQLTGTLSLQDHSSYSGGYSTHIRNNTINGNSTFTILGSNTFNESEVASSANTFNGNVVYNCNGIGSLYTSHGAKSTFNGNVTINRTVAGYTRAFNAGATITGNLSYVKNNFSGSSDFGSMSTKTAVNGTINMNVLQTTADRFELFWLVNNTPGGTITVSNTQMNVQRDSLKVGNFSVTGYGGSAYAYLYDNQIEGALTLQDAISYASGYSTYVRNNTISGNATITITGSNTYNDGDVSNSGNTYLGNVTYNRNSGAMNIATVDTNNYAGNLTFNNSSALPITAELIRFNGSANTSVDQTGTGSIIIQKPIIAKTLGAKVTLNKPVTTSVLCTFVSGYINSTTTNPLIFPDNITHNGASDNSHVVGCVTKAGNDIFTFPLGNGLGYHPLAITAPAVATDSFQASIVLKHPSDDGYNVNLKDAALLQIAPYHYWTLNQINGTNSEAVSLGWSIPCANTVIASLPGMAVARWNGTQWNNLGNVATTGASALGTVTQSGTTASYGVFGLATTSASNSWQITTTSASATTVCAGTSTTLTAAGANTYNWMPGNLSGASVVVTPLVTTTYTVTGTSSTGCITTATRTITVNPVPTPNAGTDRTHTCTSPSSTIGTAGVAGTSYAWLPTSGLTASNIAQPIANPTATTTYTVTATITATGCTASDAVVVTVNKTPPIANAGADKTNTCTTPSQTIGTTAVGGNTYAWSPSLGLSSNTIAQPVANPANTNTYTVTVTNTANGCTATDAVIVTVNKTPPVANAGVDKTNTCSTPSNTIGTTSVAGNTYAWLPSAGLSATNIAQPVANPISTTNYTVTVTTTANGCTATDVVAVNVNKTPPSVNTSATSTSICSGGSTTLTATGATSYTWQPGSLTGSSITVSPTTTTTYTVTGTNSSNGCTATSTRTITVSTCPTNLTVKAYLDGYYLGGGLMQPVLTNQGQTPSVANQCDNVTIELRNPNPPYALVSTAIRPILTNGTITSGYFNILGQSFYIVIKHRNGLETWSANPVVMTAALTYDFTTAAGQAYGGNQKQVAPGIWAMYNSDINQDDAVDALDYLLLDVDIQNGASGYLNTDINGDGSVDALDYLVMESDILNGVTASTP